MYKKTTLEYKRPKNGLYYDTLTKIYNRRGFYHVLDSLIHDAKNAAEEYTLIFCNIRNFKVINEIHGPDIGDQILIALADEIKCRQPIACARMDGDRFIFCISRRALDIDALVRFSKHTFHYDTVTITYRLRFGLYIIKDKSLSINAMCDRAKAAKRYINDEFYIPYAIWDESMREKIVNEGLFLEEFQTALDSRQFVIYYQPIVDAQTKAVVSAESLIRWQHPEKGLISPGEFIPVFEKTAAIVKLDYFVGASVADFLSNRLKKHQSIVPISVNSSRMDFRNHRIVDHIKAKIKRAGLLPEHLRLEITESIYALEPDQILADVQKLRDFGITVLLDDFGSGYSSFNTLHRIDVDILKIDMKFIKDFHKNAKCKIILSSIITMAHQLDSKVVAEGVETAEEYAFLRDAGCDYIQGYYFYKPMPEEQFAALLDTDSL